MHPLSTPRGLTCLRLVLACLWVGLGTVVAQEVEVTSVTFTSVRAPLGGNSGNWIEAEVGLTVKPVAGTPGQMVSRVRVALLVGYDLPPTVAGGQRRLDHYRAEAECVALEPGRADVRFYLPPELVKRDQLHADPKYWGVELAVGGRSLLASRAAYAVALGSAEQRKNFQTRGSASAAANDGILLPQYLTPFANDNRRGSAPSFVRKDAR
jgi:hypothetical protein